MKKLFSWFSISGGLYVTINMVLWGAIIKLNSYVRSLPSKPIVPDYYDYEDKDINIAMGIADYYLQSPP